MKPILLGALACLNLDGHLSGDCLYKSTNYGDLSGHLEFVIHQKACDQIQIDGADIKIPGVFEHQETSQNRTETTRIQMTWKDPLQNRLGFRYEFWGEDYGQLKDKVLLEGEFSKIPGGFQLHQSGIVDGDQVKIQCKLRRI